MHHKSSRCGRWFRSRWIFFVRDRAEWPRSASDQSGQTGSPYKIANQSASVNLPGQSRLHHALQGPPKAASVTTL